MKVGEMQEGGCLPAETCRERCGYGATGYEPAFNAATVFA